MDFARTGLPGVPEFHTATAEAVEAGLAFVALAIDVAEVVTANIAHGWRGGNAVIEGQAVRLQEILGDRALFHLGGDLFVALLIGEDGAALSAEIQTRLAEPIAFGAHQLDTNAWCWAITPRAGEPAAALFGHIASLEAKSWSAVHRQSRALFAGARSFADLAERIATSGVERLQLRAMRVSIRGDRAEAGNVPERPADGLAPTSSEGVTVEWWVQDGGASDLGSIGEPISAAIDAQVDVLAAVAVERNVGDHDPLTGLLNRRGFLRGVADLEGTFTIVLADIDRLKVINDTYGHDSGDRALCRVAGLLADGRAGDLVARWGGEEFVVALAGTTPDGASAWLRRLIERGRDVVDERERITFSAGVVAREPGEPVDAAVARADVALYAAKAAGRATVIVA